MKDDTRLEGPYTFGEMPIERNNKTDWKKIWEASTLGKLDDIPEDIRFRHYKTILAI